MIAYRNVFLVVLLFSFVLADCKEKKTSTVAKHSNDSLSVLLTHGSKDRVCTELFTTSKDSIEFVAIAGKKEHDHYNVHFEFGKDCNFSLLWEQGQFKFYDGESHKGMLYNTNHEAKATEVNIFVFATDVGPDKKQQGFYPKCPTIENKSDSGHSHPFLLTFYMWHNDSSCDVQLLFKTSNYSLSNEVTPVPEIPSLAPVSESSSVVPIIVGCAVGGAVLLSLVVICICCICRKCRTTSNEHCSSEREDHSMRRPSKVLVIKPNKIMEKEKPSSSDLCDVHAKSSPVKKAPGNGGSKIIKTQKMVTVTPKQVKTGLDKLMARRQVVETDKKPEGYTTVQAIQISEDGPEEAEKRCRAIASQYEAISTGMKNDKTPISEQSAGSNAAVPMASEAIEGTQNSVERIDKTQYSKEETKGKL